MQPQRSLKDGLDQVEGNLKIKQISVHIFGFWFCITLAKNAFIFSSCILPTA